MSRPRARRKRHGLGRSVPTPQLHVTAVPEAPEQPDGPGGRPAAPEEAARPSEGVESQPGSKAGSVAVRRITVGAARPSPPRTGLGRAGRSLVPAVDPTSDTAAPPEQPPTPTRAQRRARRLTAVALGVVVVGAAVAYGIAHRGHGALAPGAAAGLRAVVSDDFTEAQLDSSIWATCFPPDPTQPGSTGTSGCRDAAGGDQQWYVPGQVTTGRGATLVAEAKPTVGRDASGITTYDYRSGMISTGGRFSFVYGYVQVTATLPAVAGTRARIVLLPSAGSAPSIDIADITGDNPQVLHLGADGTGGRRATEDIPASSHPYAPQTFGIRWQPDSLTWFVDGHQVFSERTIVPFQTMYLAIELSVTSSMTQAKAANLPASLTVTRVRILR